MANSENFDKGAREMASLLDANNAAAVEERLRSDLYQMKPDEVRQFVQKVSEHDIKDTGLDLELTNGKVILSQYENAAAKVVGLKSTEVFSQDMGRYWSDPGMKVGNERYVMIGVGFRDAAEEEDRKQNKGRFIEQK